MFQINWNGCKSLILDRRLIDVFNNRTSLLIGVGGFANNN